MPLVASNFQYAIVVSVSFCCQLHAMQVGLDWKLLWLPGSSMGGRVECSVTRDGVRFWGSVKNLILLLLQLN